MDVYDISRKLVVQSEEDNMLQVENFVDEMVEDYNIAPEVYGKINVAVSEAVRNAIIHGNQDDSNKKVQISCTIKKNKLIFTIKDEGKGFDYKNLPNPSEIEEEELEGKGIYLMKYLADSVEYKESGSEVRLSFFI